MPALRLALAAALALVLTAPTASADGVGKNRPSRSGVEPAPVASLEPARTAALWSSLVGARERALRTQAPAQCRPLRAVFYAASDWLRLATKLAATASPCAEYYVSVPPLVADKTTFRRNQAWRIRALGPNFHALAEIHFATWSRWVASTGSTWHAAGVTARERMAEAGYDVALGDTWALNELTSAVRRGDGNARVHVREFLRGLYEGDGTQPTRGAVLVIGVSQRTSDLSVYQNTLQNWLADTEFWTEVATYVSDWSQEVYGDVRSHAVPGVPTVVRRAYLNDFLQHKVVLANIGPPEEVERARAYLQEAYSPLANAAWQRGSGYGWTVVPADSMSAYVSAQVDALRSFSVAARHARDHWGFAWAPRNTGGLVARDFATQTGRILDRLGAAIRDSGAVDPESPDTGACGPPGQDLWCTADLEGARHNEGWRAFRSWTQAALGFLAPEQSIAAGTPSSPIGIALVTSTGLRITSGPPRVLTLRSSSPQGAFSTTPSGPWTPTLDATVAVRADAVFFYRDTLAGRHTITGSAEGTTTGRQLVTVTAGPAATIAIAPGSIRLRARGLGRFTATAADAYGNAVSSEVAWRVTPPALGTIAPGPAGTATFTAGRLLRAGTVTASAGAASASASVTVSPGKLRVRPLLVRPGRRGLRVVLMTVDSGRRPVSLARVQVVVKRDGRRLFSAQSRTGSGGRALVRVPAARGCFTVTVTRAAARGFVWDGRARAKRVCRR